MVTKIKKFHHLDVSIGQRIRHARKLASLSQTQLGETLSISFQQIQKYESGKTRVSSSSLWEIAKRLDQPVIYFFPMPDEPTASTSKETFVTLDKRMADKTHPVDKTKAKQEP